MSFIIGFITGISIVIAIKTIKGGQKRKGLVQLLLGIISPLITILFCLKKKQFVFGGTDFEFLFQTAIVDKRVEPWIILILYISLITIMIYNVVKNKKSKKIEERF